MVEVGSVVVGAGSEEERESEEEAESDGDGRGQESEDETQAPDRSSHSGYSLGSAGDPNARHSRARFSLI